MKPTAIIFALCLLIAASCNTSTSTSSDPSCKDFRNGNFRQLTSRNERILLLRSGDLQQEVTEGLTDTLNGRINWINDCHYQMTYLDEGELKGMTIDVEIKTTTKDYYIYEARLENLTRVDTLFVIR